uniref:Uncharacterized protein n=1 Tax=Candidatus Berkiella aquae TaxID=295108 RepID=A0A0Q9YKA1_9GAMM
MATDILENINYLIEKKYQKILGVTLNFDKPRKMAEKDIDLLKKKIILIFHLIHLMHYSLFEHA